MRLVEEYLSQEEQQRIQNAIAEAELVTSGEIRVFFEPHCRGNDPFSRGLECFGSLKMHQTALQNGVLFYVALQDHKFSIIADKGINDRVPDDFWEDIADQMSLLFKKKGIVAGLTYGIRQAGQQLVAYFPVQKGDVNELSNEIVFGGYEEE